MACFFSETSAQNSKVIEQIEADEEEGEGRGVGGGGIVFDPLQPFRNYYLQAESSTEALVSIRCGIYTHVYTHMYT